MPATPAQDAYKTINRIQNNIAAAKSEPVKVSVALGSAMKEKAREDFQVELGFLQNVLDELELLSLMHDVGKITIGDNILLKPDQLIRKWCAFFAALCCDK